MIPIYSIIAVIICIICNAWIYFFRTDYDPDQQAAMSRKITFVVAIGLIIALVHDHSVEYENINRSEYTYYLDGNEVSANTIDKSLYTYKYDDETQTVYLTHKTEDNELLGWTIGFFTGSMTK